MNEEERQAIQAAREREELERFQARVRARQAELDSVKERYSTTRNVNNRKNLLWLFFAILLAAGAWGVTRLLTSGLF